MGKKCYQKNNKQLNEEITSLPGNNKIHIHLLMCDDHLKDTQCLSSQCVTNSPISVSEKYAGFSSSQWLEWDCVLDLC